MMTSESKLHYGWKVESQAEAWYRNRTPGARLVARNFRCRAGEIDLIFEETEKRGRTELVFIEVRARLSEDSWESAVESVGLRKRLRLVRAIQVFLSRYSGPACTTRLDILGWDGRNWEHLRNQWLETGYQRTHKEVTRET